MIAFPKELGSIKGMIKRFGKAKERKAPWINHMRECYQYGLPQRETFYSHSPGQKKNVTIYDDTAVIAVPKFASRLQATLVPPWREFTIFAPGSDIDKKNHEQIQEQLDDVTSIVFDHINHSNFSTQVVEAFHDLAVGTGALICNEGDSDNLLDFTAVPLSELYLEEGPRSTVETVWREHKVQVANVPLTWIGAELSPKLKKMAEDDPTAQETFIEGVVHEPKANKYHHMVLQDDSEDLIFHQVYDVTPWIVFRWMTVPGEVYGRGPLMQVLPTIKTANKVKEFVLRNAHLAVAGAYTGMDDGILNPYTMRVSPGIVIPVGSNDRGNPSLAALPRSGDFNVSDLILENLEKSIKDALFNSRRSAEGPVKSATEIAIDNKELVEDIGSSFGRLQTELIGRLMSRVVYILKTNGKIPDIKVDGKEITLKHTSPLALSLIHI